MSAEHHVSLICHPSKRMEEVHAIEATVRRSAGAELQINFRLRGDIAHIQIPPPVEARFASHLWQHTCFEAFVAAEGQSAYYEFNFAPSGEWAVYALSGYRHGEPLADETVRPKISTRSGDSWLELDATVPLNGLPLIQAGSSLRIGLSAVIEAGGGLSYWALCHPASKPDFHDAQGFTLRLDPQRIDR